MRPPRSMAFYLFLAAGPALLLLGQAARLLPPSVQPACLTHRLTGLPCPGCGTYRALAAVAAFRWKEALLTQPVMTLVFLVLLAGSAWAWTLWVFRKKGPPAPALPGGWWKWAVAAVTAAWLLNWLYLIAAGI